MVPQRRMTRHYFYVRRSWFRYPKDKHLFVVRRKDSRLGRSGKGCVGGWILVREVVSNPMNRTCSVGGWLRCQRILTRACVPSWRRTCSCTGCFTACEQNLKDQKIWPLDTFVYLFFLTVNYGIGKKPDTICSRTLRKVILYDWNLYID